jgi:endonuclease G
MEIDPMTMAYARLAQRAALQSHARDANTSMIDIGLRRRDGILEDELTIRFHVRRKLSGIQLQSAAEEGQTRPVPKTIEVGRATFKTDVVKGNYHPELFSRRRGLPLRPRNDSAKRTDPLCGGLSISDPFHVTYGTLGALVVDRTNGEPMILSNWHVLVVEWSARTGQRIYQPGRMDGGIPDDAIAMLRRHAMNRNLDAAVAALLPNTRPLVNYQLGLGPITGVGKARLGMNVVKSGATTRITYGIVTGVEGHSDPIKYRGLSRVITNVMTIEAQAREDQVSAGGDSGSCWCDQETMQAVGLHFAGQMEPDCALAIDMPVVLNTLNVDLDTRRTNLRAPVARRMPGAASSAMFAVPQSAAPMAEEVLVLG